ncbi:hypothetical protein HK101_011750 [Irineochytrium annulatum]|nr:hypothetical protein HK101_011750 [Irineochytrium annulatum]
MPAPTPSSTPSAVAAAAAGDAGAGAGDHGAGVLFALLGVGLIVGVAVAGVALWRRHVRIRKGDEEFRGVLRSGRGSGRVEGWPASEAGHVSEATSPGGTFTGTYGRREDVKLDHGAYGYGDDGSAYGAGYRDSGLGHYNDTAKRMILTDNHTVGGRMLASPPPAYRADGPVSPREMDRRARHQHLPPWRPVNAVVSVDGEQAVDPTVAHSFFEHIASQSQSNPHQSMAYPTFRTEVTDLSIEVDEGVGEEEEAREAEVREVEAAQEAANEAAARAKAVWSERSRALLEKAAREAAERKQ